MVLSSLVFFAPLSAAHAQSTSAPQIFITWAATNSYAPSSYIGKVLPNQQSQIVASLEVIANGKPVNISGQTIYWYQDENLIGGGIGAQSIVFRPYGEAPNTVTLRAELPDYPGGSLMHEIDIPLVQSQAVINAPFPQGNFSSRPLVLQAIPYFWNASSATPLSFTWSVNDQTVTGAENPETLQVTLPQNTPAGYAIAVSLTIQNGNDGSTANSTANVIYEPQL